MERELVFSPLFFFSFLFLSVCVEKVKEMVQFVMKNYDQAAKLIVYVLSMAMNFAEGLIWFYGTNPVEWNNVMPKGMDFKRVDVKDGDKYFVISYYWIICVISRLRNLELLKGVPSKFARDIQIVFLMISTACCPSILKELEKRLSIRMNVSHQQAGQIKCPFATYPMTPEEVKNAMKETKLSDDEKSEDEEEENSGKESDEEYSSSSNEKTKTPRRNKKKKQWNTNASDRSGKEKEKDKTEFMGDYKESTYLVEEKTLLFLIQSMLKDKNWNQGFPEWDGKLVEKVLADKSDTLFRLRSVSYLRRVKVKVPAPFLHGKKVWMPLYKIPLCQEAMTDPIVDFRLMEPLAQLFKWKIKEHFHQMGWNGTVGNTDAWPMFITSLAQSEGLEENFIKPLFPKCFSSDFPLDQALKESKKVDLSNKRGRAQLAAMFMDPKTEKEKKKSQTSKRGQKRKSVSKKKRQKIVEKDSEEEEEEEPKFKKKKKKKSKMTSSEKLRQRLKNIQVQSNDDD